MSQQSMALDKFKPQVTALLSARGFWIVLLVLSVIRGLIYGAVIPPWQAPDEPQHYEHARLVAKHGRSISRADLSGELRDEIISSMESHRFWLFAPMPVKPRTPAEVPDALQAYWDASHGEYYQPFLYYWLQAQAVGGLEVQDTTVQLYLMRLLSTLMGGAVVVLTYFSMRVLFPRDAFMQLTVPSLVLFLPMHAHLTSAVNNDNLAELGATVVLFIVTLIVINGLTPMRFVLLAGVIIAGMYSKTTFLFVIPLAGLGILIRAWLRLSPRARWLVLGGTAVLVLIVTALVFLVPSSLFSPLKQVPVLRLAMGFPFSPSEMLQVLKVRWMPYTTSLFKGFWGSFGWYSLQLPAWLYWILGGMTLAAGVGLIRFVVRVISGSIGVGASQASVLVLYGLAFFLTLSLTVLRFLGANVGWSGYNVTDLPQGRFLFPAILAIGMLFMLGLREVIPARYRSAGAMAVIVSLILVDLIALVAVVSYYYGPGAGLAMTAPHADLEAPAFSDGIEYPQAVLQTATPTPGGAVSDEYAYAPLMMRNFSSETDGSPSPTSTPTQTPSPTPSPTPTPSLTPIPPFTVYGVALGEGNPDRETKARQAGADWYRVIIRWDRIEPDAPADDVHAYNWSGYDNLISGLWQRGLHPLVEIRGIPEWALAPDQPNCGLMSVEGLQAYSAFLAALVERSDGDGAGDISGSPSIRHWEIGNEVDKRTAPNHFGLCYGDHPEEYAQLLARSWDAIKAADAQAKVVFGGLAYENCCGFNSDPLDQVAGLDFLEQVLNYIEDNKGSRDPRTYFDVMNIHAYLWFVANQGYDPPDVRTKYQIVRDKLATHCPSCGTVPLMNTEGGRMSNNEVIWDIPTNPERQARYVPVFFIRSLAADLRAVFWFAMMDFSGQGFGLLTEANAPKPAYWAYMTLTEELAGFTYERELTTSDTGSADVEGHVFESTRGNEKWVVYVPPHKEQSGITSRQMTFPFGRVRRVEHEKYAGEALPGTLVPGAVTEIGDGDPGDLGPAEDGKVTLEVTLDPIYVEGLEPAGG